MKTQLILDFLRDLKDNNNKTWFEANKKTYQTAKQDFEEIIKRLLGGVMLFDNTIQDIEPKKCIFRINRDVRFSTDKSPYKTNFGASIQQGGKKSGLGGYYIHLQPGGESFLAGGVYMPMPPELAKIRQEIDYNGAEFRQIISAPDFSNYFGEISGDKVKTTPKGYKVEHPDIELLKLKSFIAWHKMSDAAVLETPNLDQHIMAVFQAMKPLNDFLNRALE
jgi:uncharacterized protein (TIGR02453 family)